MTDYWPVSDNIFGDNTSFCETESAFTADHSTFVAKDRDDSAIRYDMNYGKLVHSVIECLATDVPCLVLFRIEAITSVF